MRAPAARRVALRRLSQEGRSELRSQNAATMNRGEVLGVGFWVLVRNNQHLKPKTQNLLSVHRSSFRLLSSLCTVSVFRRARGFCLITNLARVTGGGARGNRLRAQTFTREGRQRPGVCKNRRVRRP